MTDAGRAKQITTALAEYEAQHGPKETLMVPLRTGNKALPVITLPLDLPVLNAKSFRIAPELADHSQAGAVVADPFSASSQRVVAELVVKAHRHTIDLKDSLKQDGQDNPGVITREGVLINANTRCVLMRELLRDGDLRTDGFRAAVLPAGVTNAELFDLEAVLQKRKEHKDDYNLVSELLMLKVLHDQAGMSAHEIARRQNLRTSEDVTIRLRVLDLMERARRLAEPPLPIHTFARERDKLQNWKELLLRVDDLEAKSDVGFAERHIKEWLVPYLLGHDSVHVLRGATEGWIDRHGIDALEAGDDLSAVLAAAAGADRPRAEPDLPEPSGLDLLDLGSPSVDGQGSPAADNLFDITLAVLAADPEAEVELPDGSIVAALEVRERLQRGVKRGLDVSRARIRAGGRLDAPEKLARNARDNLESALKALEDVSDEASFQGRAAGLRAVLDEISGLLDEANELLTEPGEDI